MRYPLILLVLSLGLVGFALATAAKAERQDPHWTGVALSHQRRS